MRSESLLINKLNLLLVGVLKMEWPKNWPSFIPEIVGASKYVLPLGASVRACVPRA